MSSAAQPRPSELSSVPGIGWALQRDFSKSKVSLDDAGFEFSDDAASNRERLSALLESSDGPAYYDDVLLKRSPEAAAEDYVCCQLVVVQRRQPVFPSRGDRNFSVRRHPAQRFGQDGSANHGVLAFFLSPPTVLLPLLLVLRDLRPRLLGHPVLRRQQPQHRLSVPAMPAADAILLLWRVPLPVLH